LILIGVLECIAVGWMFDPEKVLKQINLNADKFKMPKKWFVISVKYISPIALSVLFVWNLYTLFVIKGGHYGYAFWAEFIGGWCVSALVFASGFIVKLVVKIKQKKGFVENEVEWIDEE
jgi:NSS family neurotransmitter:Na+ symporter